MKRVLSAQTQSDEKNGNWVFADGFANAKL
jgi:hypothetical protein